MKDKIRKINIPIYGCQVIVAFTNNFKKTGKKFKQKFKSEVNDYCGLALKMNRSYSKYMILVKHKYSKDWNVLSHESLHITNFILEDRGVGVSVKNDEAQTYLMGYIIGHIQKNNRK